MSRNLFIVTCALLTLLGLGLSDGLRAQQSTDPSDTKPARPARSDARTPQSAEDRIEAALDGQLRMPLEFIDTPLADLFTQLQEEYQIPIQFDRAALDEVAVSTDTEVSINLSEISLRSALELIFRQPDLQDLTTIIDEEVLLITTEDVAEGTLVVTVYRVDDFEHATRSSSETDSSAICYAFLQDVIVSCIEFDSWSENGTGEGEIHLMKPGLLVVSQTRGIHRKIKDLLADLREVKSEIEGPSGNQY